MDVDTVASEIESGKSLAEIAAENGVDPHSLIDELVAQENALVNGLLTSGAIDAEEAAEWRGENELFTAFEVRTLYREPETVAAATIGIGLDQMWAALELGQSIQSIAESAGVSAQTVVDAVVESEMAYIDKMVEAGLIEAEEREVLKSEIASEVSSIVSSTFSDYGCGEEETELD